MNLNLLRKILELEEVIHEGISKGISFSSMSFGSFVHGYVTIPPQSH